MGAIRRFENIVDLANSYRIPAAEMVLTHNAVQKASRSEDCDLLGRKGYYIPLEPPYYGSKVTGALFHTQGGLIVNKTAQVIRKDGSPISNLYAGGGTAAGFSGKTGPKGYLSANGLLAALIPGKIAGIDAGKGVL